VIDYGGAPLRLSSRPWQDPNREFPRGLVFLRLLLFLFFRETGDEYLWTGALIVESSRWRGSGCGPGEVMGGAGGDGSGDSTSSRVAVPAGLQYLRFLCRFGSNRVKIEGRGNVGGRGLCMRASERHAASNSGGNPRSERCSCCVKAGERNQDSGFRPPTKPQASHVGKL
jgi:hypothetical protein